MGAPEEKEERGLKEEMDAPEDKEERVLEEEEKMRLRIRNREKRGTRRGSTGRKK
jgi:hypothetical protein